MNYLYHMPALKLISGISALLILSSISPGHRNISSANQLPDKNSPGKWDACDSTNSLYFYQGSSEFLDLESLKWVDINGTPAYSFKKCSKYKYQFMDYQSVRTTEYKGTKFEILEKNDLKITKPTASYIIKSACTDISQFHSGDFLILDETGVNHINPCEEGGYTISRYNELGGKTRKTIIKDDWITVEGNTHNYEMYRNLDYYLGNQLIFYVNQEVDPNKTGVLTFDLQDHSIQEYHFISNGYAIDQSGNGKAAGLFSWREKELVLHMTNTEKQYSIPSENVRGSCKGIIIGKLLVIASCHFNSTGSSLFCYNLEKEKMEWVADVEQLNVGHSKYYNYIYPSIYKDKVILEGNEAYGRYLQIFDLYSGKKLFSHFDKGDH